MERELSIEFHESLNRLVTAQKFDQKYIVVFGANATGSSMINYLKEQDIVVDAVIDNNPLLHLKQFLEIEVSSPENILIPFKSNAFILIASKYYEEMKLQLEFMGYKENEHIIRVVNLNKYAKFDLSEETFDEARQRVRRGLGIFQGIQRKYGESTVVMSPVRPNGDVYMMCSYLQAYIEKLKVGSAQNIVVTVIGNSCESTAELFDINHIENLSKEESSDLAAYANFNADRIKVINPYFSHLELYNYVDGYKGIRFLDVIKHGLLGLKPADAISKPKHEHRVDIVQQVFDEYGLEENNTVILAPYANSIPQIKRDIWEKIAKKLKSKNYVVCTNCGTKEERPIKGTKPVMFSFRDAVAVTEKAGYLVAYRSGFCEIIADSSCKKIVVYPDHNIGLINLINFFGMDHEMYRQENLIQIEHSFSTSDELVEAIVEHF